MKRFLLPFSVAALVLMSCNSKSSSNQNILTAQNLKSAFIYLSADSAYNLKTAKGAILKIAENSFDVKGNEKLRLEIKEAYSAGDILLAGLTTRSNGKLLQSGGMIYINATSNGKKIELLKPINVSIPSASYDERMQLFKGEVENDGSINWVAPQPLDTSPVARNIINGKALFKANCASCHKPTMEFTGPVLAKCREREPDRDWAYRFTRNPSAMTQTDAYARTIFQKYNKTQMTAFPNLNRADVNAILDYCDNEAILNPLPKANTATPASFITGDSASSTQQINNCGLDTFYYPVPDTNILVLPFISKPDTNQINNSPVPEIPMYQFNIDQSGWYNVDCFVDANRDMVTTVNLIATLKMPKPLNMQVYLCIPQRKLLTYGMEKPNKEYEFYEAGGSIPLVLNDEAIIFAIGSDSTNAYYGITRFTVQAKQNIRINVKASTKEDILKAIKSNKLDGIKIEIEKPEIYFRQSSLVDSSKTDKPKEEMQMQIIKKPCNGENINSKIIQKK